MASVALCWAQAAKAQETLFGLAGSGGGGFSANGFTVAGTGFFGFNPANPTVAPVQIGSPDTSMYIATAFAFNPSLSVFYLEKQESDGFHLVSVDSSGTESDIALLPMVFKIFTFDSATNTLFGLAGPGGGGITAVFGLTVSGKGFASFNLTTGVETLLSADTSPYVGTAVAPNSSGIYLERQESDGFHLVSVPYATGTAQEVFGPLANIFKIFTFDSAANTLYGLAGSGGGGLTANGLTVSGTGFFSFNPATPTVPPVQIGSSDTSMYIGTAYAFNPSLSVLYLEKQESDGFHLVAVNSTGAESDIALLATVFKLFIVRGTSCPVNVTLSISDSKYMRAKLTAPNPLIPDPNLTALSILAASCGYLTFDWQQQITILPGPSPFFPRFPSLISNQNKAQDGSLMASPTSPFFDPPPGGYTYDKDPSYNPSPLFYPLSYVAVGSNRCTIPLGLTICAPGFAFIASSDGTTLSFVDDPTDGFLPGDATSANPTPGHFIALLTSLVGVDKNHKPVSPPLYSWTWNSTFNGSAGGVTCTSAPCPISQTSSLYPVIPGSGTGGVTVTSINGVPQTLPTITCEATPNTLWPPDGKPVLVTVSGNIIQGTSPLASGGTSYTVIDEHGENQPNGSFVVQTAGSYSFGTSLIAARNGNDRNGRQYTIIVSATDSIGNDSSCSAVVTVPHDQGIEP